MEKKLYRSDDNKIVFGICGGIGEYFDIDPVIVRLILIVLVCIGFSGLVAYIIAVFVIPRKPTSTGTTRSTTPASPGSVQGQHPEDNRPGVIKAYEGTYTVDKEE